MAKRKNNSGDVPGAGTQLWSARAGELGHVNAAGAVVWPDTFKDDDVPIEYLTEGDVIFLIGECKTSERYIYALTHNGNVGIIYSQWFDRC